MGIGAVGKILLMLSGESLIDINLLAMDEQLISLISLGKSYTELMEYLNENY
jgi:hypothetical protein